MCVAIYSIIIKFFNIKMTLETLPLKISVYIFILTILKK